jgi:hypothetical protein
MFILLRKESTDERIGNKIPPVKRCKRLLDDSFDQDRSYSSLQIALRHEINAVANSTSQI